MLCRGCAQECDKDFCEPCSSKTYDNLCGTCGLSCLLKYCVPCYLDFKLRRKCAKCFEPSDKKYCDECFNTPEVCSGCGGSKRPGNESCFKCTKYKWLPCAICQTLTPLDTLCLHCSDNYCKQCHQPSKRTFCNQCWSKRPKCEKCNKFINPGFETCRDCKSTH